MDTRELKGSRWQLFAASVLLALWLLFLLTMVVSG
jgi:hypothetical protein